MVEQVRLEAQDRLLLYTDGLVEARAADRRQFELDDRAEACLTAATLDQALDSLVELLLAHSGGRLNDDLALVLTPSWHSFRHLTMSRGGRGGRRLTRPPQSSSPAAHAASLGQRRAPDGS